MDYLFVPQRYYQINVFCSGQYRTNCACLLQRYGCICHTCFMLALSQLQIDVPKLVAEELIDLTLIASRSKSKSFSWASCTDRLSKKFTSKSKETWTKDFFQANRYPLEHFSESFEAIKRFVFVLYVLKSSKITVLAEARWNVFSKMQKTLQKK